MTIGKFKKADRFSSLGFTVSAMAQLLLVKLSDFNNNNNNNNHHLASMHLDHV